MNSDKCQEENPEAVKIWQPQKISGIRKIPQALVSSQQKRLDCGNALRYLRAASF
jgi:hypothetical protein